MAVFDNDMLAWMFRTRGGQDSYSLIMLLFFVESFCWSHGALSLEFREIFLSRFFFFFLEFVPPIFSKRVKKVDFLKSDFSHHLGPSLFQVWWIKCLVWPPSVGEGNGNPLQCSCLENPRDGVAWWAAVCGVAQSRTRLKRLSSGSSVAIIFSIWSISPCFLSVLTVCSYPFFLVSKEYF